MSLCVLVDPVSNIVTATSVAVESCTSYVLTDATAYNNAVTLSALVSMPTIPDMQAMWYVGFSLPVICYMVAWAYQAVITFISQDH